MKLSDVLTPEILTSGKFWTHSMTLVDGCTKVSPGCLNCWSEAVAKRFGATGKPSVFDGRIIEHPERCADILPRSIRRKPRVWTYWNDVFHEGVSDGLRDRLFRNIKASRHEGTHHDYHIICTKRPEVALRYLSGRDASKFDNLILMVTMENQGMVRERLPHINRLLHHGWKVGALVEPMLTPVDLENTCVKCGHHTDAECPSTSGHCIMRPALSWIICGPENGKGKRPFDGQWAMRLQAQAQAAGIPFYYKAGLLNGKRYIETP